jgi:hypothetical protein
MRRFLLFAVATTAAGLIVVTAACSSSVTADRTATEDAARREGGIVQPPEAGVYDAGAPEGPEPSCAKYCDLVMESCTGEHAQYASRDECLGLCARLPAGDAGDDESNTVSCRQFYAGSPARTNAGDYCLAAGPFGGGVCGDRCTAFCGLSLSVCSPDAGAAAAAPYGSYPDCASACAGYPYQDGGADGGGEPPDGPATGDTLNCRLFHVRAAVKDGSGCANVAADSGACR